MQILRLMRVSGVSMMVNFSPSKSTLFRFEGPEGVKLELGIAYFVLGKGKLYALGLAFTAKKIKIRNGIKI